MNNVDRTIKLLNDVFVFDAVFDYKKAMNRLNKKKDDKEITLHEYIDLVDACNSRNDDGHYQNSRMYKRATRNT